MLAYKQSLAHLAPATQARIVATVCAFYDNCIAPARRLNADNE